MRRLPLAVAALAAVATLAGAAEPAVRLVTFDTEVTGASAGRIVGSIDDAEAAGDALVLVELDTPGGLVSAMETIVKRMLAAKVPVVVWVGPSGAKAASAGFLILLAADVAAMAPGTRTGAASVVGLMGPNQEGDVLLKKATSDIAGLARTIAEHRGRRVDLVQEAVVSAASYTDTTALEQGLIDLVARDRADLLAALDGREVRRFDGTTTILKTEGARFVTTERTRSQRLAEGLASPIVAFSLLLFGLACLYIEFTHPGLVLPGVAGLVSLVLFAFAVQMLPFSVLGLLLILTGVALFVLEVKVTSYGALTVGGLVCVVIGALMLFPGPIPELRLPLAVVLPGALTLAAVTTIAVRLAVRAHRTPVATGVEGLVGEVATVTEALAPKGRVFVHGEIWDATCGSGYVSRDAFVRIVGVAGMVLRVEPAEDTSRKES